jgi:L-asparaginase II
MTMRLIAGRPLVAVVRGGRVEAVHNVAGYAVDRRGSALLSFGTTGLPVYLRSAAKPFITAAVLTAGVGERFKLETREIAVLTASHNAEAFHLDAVRSILQKIGLTEAALQCGPEPPYTQAICNNCSGKHAGILALCVAIGADPATYLDPENPAQQQIFRFCAEMLDERPEDLAFAVDGCGIPVVAATLEKAARAYQRLATLEGVEPATAQALRKVRDAMIAYPEYMSGTGEFDAALIRAYGGSLVCKGGAEGVFAAAIFERGVGLVLKVIDGNERARPPAAIEALAAIDAISPAQRSELERFARPPVMNKAGRIVGEICPVTDAFE